MTAPARMAGVRRCLLQGIPRCATLL